MIKKTLKLALAATLLMAAGAANADFGVGVKAGTLGVGVEGRWAPLPWLDVRAGANQYDYEGDGSYAGIPYDGELDLSTYFLTGNLRVPLSPMRFTVGAFSNGNEFAMVNQPFSGPAVDIGGSSFTPADVGVLTSKTTFSSTAPYVGVGFDFEVFGKAGINLDFGVLWQGDPTVTMQADGLASGLPAFQTALEAERQQLEDDMSDFKAWPVVSLGFVYNF